MPHLNTKVKIAAAVVVGLWMAAPAVATAATPRTAG